LILSFNFVNSVSAQICEADDLCGMKANNNNVTTFTWTSGSQSSPSKIQYYYSATATSGVLSEVYNPFFDPGCGSNTNIIKFCGEPNPDFLWNDGWEFVHSHLGTPQKGVKHPTFTLYNRHTGILRVFANLTTATLGQVALIRMEHIGSTKTSLLSAYERGASHALNQFGSAQLTYPAINNRNVQDAYRWVYADFKMVYDPCTCLFNSSLLFSVIIVNESSIDAQLNLIFNLNLEATLKAESKVSMGTGKDAVATFVGYSNEGLGFLKSVLGTPANISNPDLAAIATAIPEVAATLSIMKFLWSTFVPASPSTTITKFDAAIRGTIKGSGSGTFTGIISNQQNVEDWTIRTPGSQNTPYLPAQATYYNNQLGVFNLLEAPIVKRRDIYHDSTLYFNYDPPFTDWSTQTIIRPRFECTGFIRYMLNPAAGDCISEVKASYFIEYMDGKTEESISLPLNCFRDFKFVPQKGRVNVNYPGYSYISENNPIKNVYIKVSGRLDASNGSGVGVVFAELYNVTVTSPPYDIFVGNSAEVSSTFPDIGCGGFYEPAEYPMIANVCIGSAYRQASGQSLVKKGEEEKATIDKAKEDFSVSISPNPVQNEVVIRYNLPKEENKVSIQILNINGQVVATILPPTLQTIGEQTLAYNASELANGVYMIRILSDEGNKITKMVVTH
jgi:hypothetical protein